MENCVIRFELELEGKVNKAINTTEPHLINVMNVTQPPMSQNPQLFGLIFGCLGFFEKHSDLTIKRPHLVVAKCLRSDIM